MRVGRPCARTGELVVEEFSDELLIYDRKTHRAHCLGVTAARVWSACDGESDLEALSLTLGLPADEVTRALEELDHGDLLDRAHLVLTGGEETLAVESHCGGAVTRRHLAKAGTAVAVAPLILSIAAPSPAAAATPTPFLCSLYSSNSCGGGNQGCGSIAGCCCCCQSGAGNVSPACKVCSSTSVCLAGLQKCPDGTIGKCSDIGAGNAANIGGCCSYFPITSNFCGCAYGGAAGCCDATTKGPCTNSVNCVPCCRRGTPRLISESSPFGCCTATSNNC
jgi:hypothetical protein